MTEPALLLAPLACSLVLIVSGAAKLRDRDSTREAFISLKVPAALSTPLAVGALPYGELVLGALLLVTWGWVLTVVAVAATVLFATYLLLVTRTLLSGDEVDCHCFGSLGASRITVWTVVRNVLLVVLAALAAVLGAGASGLVVLADDLGRPGWSWLLMTALVASTVALVVSPGRASPVAGEDALLDYERRPIPFAMLRGQDGEQVTLRELAAERPQLLVFMAVGCGACTVVAEKMPEWAGSLGPVQVNGVFTDPLDDLPADLALPGVTRWYDVERGCWQTFASNGRPAAVLLGADGQLAGGPVMGRADIVAFVDEILAELAEAELPEPVPHVIDAEDDQAEADHEDHEHSDHGGHDHGGHEHADVHTR